MATVEPKINRRKQIRLAIALLSVAACFAAWYFLQDKVKDVYTPASTAGWILALKETDGGTQATVIKPDGSEIAAPHPSSLIEDRDLVWQPDGARAFLSSNRDEKKNAFHIYSWDLSQNSLAQKTLGSRSQQRPIFDKETATDGRPTALVISGGIVVDFNPHEGRTQQVLPFVGKGVTETKGDEGGGSGSQFGPEWENLGQSFKEAHWVQGRKYIVAIMRRDEGETLILQNMEPSSADEAKPQGLVAGEHIQLAVEPRTGVIVYSVQNFDYIDRQKLLSDFFQGKPSPYVKDGKLIKPYRHVIGLIDPAHPDASGPIAGSLDDSTCFGGAVPSPDGSQILVTLGKFDSSSFSATSLVVMPLHKSDRNSPIRPTTLVQGSVSSPSWSGDGQQIAFIMTGRTGHRDVFTMQANGEQVKDLTEKNGVNYETVSFSPAH